MASVVGKTIFSDGKGKLFFGYYKTDDAVEFVDYKTWKKLNFKDVSKGDTNKERVIKAIVKNQKQFNKKVDFNMWAKKQKRSFEDTMDWFIQNGWISNITKRGIKEGVEDVLSVNEAMKPSIKMVNKFEPKEGIQIMAVKTLDGKTHFGGMVQRGRFAKIIPFVPNQSKSDVQKRALQIFDELGKDESVNEASNGPAILKLGDKNLLKVGEKITINTGGKKREYKVVKSKGNGDFVLNIVESESVNEAMKPSQVRSAISKVKKQLMRKWKQKGGYENFGQKELSQMKDKFDYNPYGSSDERQISKMLDGFDDWAMNYDGNMREDRNSNMFYVLYQKKGVFGKPAAAGYKDRKDAEKFAKSLGNNHNTMILDKQSMKNVKGVDVKEGKKRFKRQDGIGKAKYTISYHDGKKKHKDGSDFFDIKIFKNKKDLSDFVGTLVKQGYKLTNESVNEGQLNIGDTIKVKSGNSLQKLNTIDDKWKVIKKDNSTYTLQKVGSSMKVRHPQTKVDYLIARPGQSQLPFIVESASREAMGIAALTGTRGSAVQDFIDKNRINSRKLFNALKKANLQGRINFASALAGKPGNPNEKLTIKLFGEDKGEVEKIKKQVGKNEIKFYDALSKVEKRLGSKYPKFLDTALKQLKQNPSSLKTNADKEEKLFNLVK